MRFWLTFIIVSFLTLSINAQDTSAQPTPKESGSQLTYEQVQDSLYLQRMKRSVNENGKVLDQFLADFKERQEREKRQLYIRIGLGIAFVAVLIYGLLRRRKSRQQ
jgi:hypothetical protein